MNWKHGYYADSGYTYGHYPETMPARMRWAALVQGHVAPAGGFRYLDAGCGQGVSLIMAAASHPDSEFVGIDFLPEHIAHARELAKACGLNNVQFIEGDFVELAENPSVLGEFDFAVCHGITTWIAPTVKQGLFKLLGQVLKPGGLFYNSYNTQPGWLAAVPFQHLVLLEQRSKPGAMALKAAQGHMDVLKGHAPAMFAALPALQARLEGMSRQDPAYLVQEYNNQFWNPVFVTDMIEDMAAVKLAYLGTATLPEVFDVSLAPEVKVLLAEQPLVGIREQLRDYAVNQAFRRDLYVKGSNRPWRHDQNRLLREVRVMLNPLTARPTAGEPFSIKAGSIELKGAPDFYNGILDTLSQHPEGLTVGEIVDTRAAPQRSNTVQVLCMLIHGGWVLASQAQSVNAAPTNKALARAVTAGAPYRYLVTPQAGQGLPVTDADWCLVSAHLEGLTSDTARRQAVVDGLQAMGKALAHEGKPLEDPVRRNEMLTGVLQRFDAVMLPLLKRLGSV